MTERYPDDATLLALSDDAATGVSYIPTGKSPYYLEFRKMLYRLLRATERANDLRVYQDGDLSIGVRPGRLLINNATVDFTGATGVSINASATAHVWLDTAGNVQTGTSGLPSDRTTFVPLAEIVTGSSAIQTITDLRGEAMLAIPSLATLNVTATGDEVSQAMAGISADVTATALNDLTAGGTSTADVYHRHLGVYQDVAGEARFQLLNDNTDSAATNALQMSLPQLADDTFFSVNRDNGFFEQRYDGDAYNLLGTVHPQYTHAGELTASLTNELVGVVPANGAVTDIILSIGDNIVSSDGSDGISATVKVNGATLTSTDPSLTDDDGAGFISTAQGDGAAAVVKSDGTENVQRGDMLTLDLTRTANGSVSNEAGDVVVLVIIRVDAPE